MIQVEKCCFCVPFNYGIPILLVFMLLGSVGEILFAISYLQLGVGIFGIVACIIGIIGFCKGSPTLLIPFLVFLCLSVVQRIISVFVFVTLKDDDWIKFLNNLDPETLKKQNLEAVKQQIIVGTAVGAVVTFVLNSYFFIVVKSYYDELKEDGGYD